MATLKVNLSAVGNACDQDATAGNIFPGPGWYVFLNNCDGTPFVHAGKEYGPFPINHGYAEIKDVPPGRYVLFAIVNPFAITQPISGGELIYQSNYTSHFAVVDVCCGCHDVCVTLYNSGWHYCVQVIIYWFQLLSLQKKMKPEVAQSAIKAITTALESEGETLAGDAAINKQLEKLSRAFMQHHGDKTSGK
jgi:hypothetical protein